MFLHVPLDAVEIAEKAHMAQLVEFIRADGLKGYLIFKPCQIRLAARHHCQAGTGETYFGCRPEH